MYRIEQGEETDFLVEEPEATYGSVYTYADYLGWKIQERLELFRGRVMKMAGPNRSHQEVSGNIYLALGNYLKLHTCKVYSAPFDVRLPVKNRKKDNEITTVVQPDIIVVCDPSKLDDRGCCGTPDLVIEILSPGNSKKEVRLKYELYEEAGVKEYWIVYPVEQSLIVYNLNDTGHFAGGKTYASGDLLHSTAIPGFTIAVEQIFEN